MKYSLSAPFLLPVALRNTPRRRHRLNEGSSTQIYKDKDLNPNRPKTKLEAVNSDKGHLLVRDFYKLSEPHSQLGRMDVNAVVFSDLGRKASVRGFKIELTEGGRLERSNYSFLDIDEATELIRALNAIENLSETPATGDRYTETEFRTNGDFAVGFYTEPSGKRTAYCSSGSIGKVTIFFDDLKDISSLRQTFDEGVRLLSSK